MQPYPDQIAAASAAVKHERGILSMPTGSGKSLVIRLIIEALKVRTLVIVPSLEIKKQLKQVLTGLNVSVENIDSRALIDERDYDCLIIDEAHHAAAKTYRKLNKTAWNGIYYRFFLTATPFRNDTEETLLFESIAGQVIYELSYSDAVLKGYIVPVESYYIEIPKQKTDAFAYSEVYTSLVVNNSLRNEIISKLLKTLQKNNVYTLCLVKEIAHGNILSELTGIPFVNGERDESRDYIRQFNKGEILSLIGTEGVISEGVDTKPCEYVIIAGLGKAKSSYMQKIGRCVRKYLNKESGKVVLFKDTSHKYLLRHFRVQVKILKEEYGSAALKINI